MTQCKVHLGQNQEVVQAPEELVITPVQRRKETGTTYEVRILNSDTVRLTQIDLTFTGVPDK